MIAESRSSETHESICNRHVRLCQRTKGTDPLIQNISPLIVNLTNKRLETQKCKQRKEEMNDGVILANSMMDDEVRTLHEKCKQYDREHPGSQLVKRIFPDGKLSEIIRASLKSQAMEMGQLIVRLNTLEQEHPLRTAIAPLAESISKEQEAQQLYREAIGQWKAAIAEEDIAKAELRKQYEHNYLDAVKLFGKRFAQRLFPKLGKSKNSSEEQITPENN